MKNKKLTYKNTKQKYKKTKQKYKKTKKYKIKRKYTRKNNRKLKHGGRVYTEGLNKNKNKNKVSGLDQSYNLKTHVRESHNCYTYFLNKKSGEVIKLCEQDLPKYNMCRRPQPGYYSGYKPLKKDDYNCPEIIKRTKADNPEIRQILNVNEECTEDEYKGAIVVAPGQDYHYYRLNDENQWTHKPGYKPSTMLDADNNIIKDPKYANRKYNDRLNYTEFCGYTCVPRDPEKKRMSHKPSNKK